MNSVSLRKVTAYDILASVTCIDAPQTFSHRRLETIDKASRLGGTVLN